MAKSIGATDGVVAESLLPASLRRKNGVVRDGVELEVLRALPGDFIFLYEQLFARCFSASGGGASGEVGVVGARRVTRVSTSQTETRGPAKRGFKGQPSDVLRDVRALAFKARIDRDLRKLSRRMRNWIEEGGSGKAHNSVRRCTRCRKYADELWSFCPFDGAPTEEWDG
jgi:hypothetical protein